MLSSRTATITHIVGREIAFASSLRGGIRIRPLIERAAL